ncbi:carbohydrate sulfotransferase 11-like [Penaeus japonicus]|uniref:carbohydrate sulfotransferase 11-like n=1 Tax=Penaeus japonicus TaxID=27405 RepID=UPI001C715BDA|nr:carbohydrate sulfotransferase 11-like [Penaeus japonicus]
MELFRWKYCCCARSLARFCRLKTTRRYFVLLVFSGLLLSYRSLNLPSRFGKTYLAHFQQRDRVSQSADRFAEESSNVSRRFFERKEILVRRCREIKAKIGHKRANSTDRSMKRARLLYNIEHNLMVCVVAKAGATSWRRHMLSLLRIHGEIMPHAKHFGKLIEAKKVIGLRKMKELLEDPNTTWVVNTRHPLERLVSAYRDKFKGGKGVQKETFSKYVGWVKKEKSENYNNSRISFYEFLKAVTLDKAKNGRTGMNLHFRPSSTICSPCNLPYDYVFHTETFSQDMSYVAGKLRLEAVDPHLRMNDKSFRSHYPTYEKFYEAIPPPLLRKIYAIYEKDFALFDYDLPSFLLEALHESDSALH